MDALPTISVLYLVYYNNGEFFDIVYPTPCCANVQEIPEDAAWESLIENGCRLVIWCDTCESNRTVLIPDQYGPVSRPDITVPTESVS